MIRPLIRTLVLAALLGPGTTALAAQDADPSRDAYFQAIATYFDVPRDEVVVLSEWRLSPDEIPVVMFMAGRAGVSPDALVALRRTGRGWSQLAAQYRVDASHFHVPMPALAPVGALDRAYAQYRSVPAARWSEVALQDRDIVILVNVRMLAETLEMPPEDVLRAHDVATSFIDLYARLVRSAGR